MVTVTFLSSIQGYQDGRVAEVAKRLQDDHPEWTVQVLPPDASEGRLLKHKLKFGPAVLVNETIEFVGVPRYRMLVERVAMVAAGKTSPRTAAPPAAPTPAKPAAAPEKPAAPPEPGR